MPPIDFFIAPCLLDNGNCRLPAVVCASHTINNRFGIYDDPPPANFPAYIMLHTPDKWIAEVHNPTLKEINFKAIDNCVPMLRADGQLESRCDGMLYYDNDLVFVELKDRAGSGWLSEGRRQLTITIQYFQANHNINNYNKVVGYVSNKQRPLAITGNSTEIQKFKDDTANLLNNTGLLLKADRNITI